MSRLSGHLDEHLDDPLACWHTSSTSGTGNGTVDRPMVQADKPMMIHLSLTLEDSAGTHR